MSFYVLFYFWFGRTCSGNDAILWAYSIKYSRFEHKRALNYLSFLLIFFFRHVTLQLIKIAYLSSSGLIYLVRCRMRIHLAAQPLFSHLQIGHRPTYLITLPSPQRTPPFSLPRVAPFPVFPALSHGDPFSRLQKSPHCGTRS